MVDPTWSEGQRKALFEDCEEERKYNADEILKLKSEISLLIVSLHENTNSAASSRIKRQIQKLEQIIGPLDDKSCVHVGELMDLQIIEKSKQLDLLRYNIKQSKKYLLKLGVEYQTLITKFDIKNIKEKVDVPIKKSTCELQNNIHAVEVQLREAFHVKNKYHDIKQSLKDDSARFESTIINLKQEIEVQNADIKKLQKVLDEAIRMKIVARSKLLQEERVATSFTNNREKEAIDGRKLVNDKKIELEKLEKKIFQGGKILIRPEPEGAEDDHTDDDKPEIPQHPCETIAQAFEILKSATGGTSIEEVLERFTSQKDTNERLMLFRRKSESEKRKLERKADILENQLEAFRYAEVKEAERKTTKMESVQQLIQTQLNKVQNCICSKAKKEEGIKIVICGLRTLFSCTKQSAILKEDEDPVIILQKIRKNLSNIIKENEKELIFETEEKTEVNMENYDEEGLPVNIKSSYLDFDINDDKWLPASYVSLVRRTPLPQPGNSPAPPPPPGSDDEDDVPSRGYLKKQAQLVVDAKTRRKTLRIQTNRN